MRISASPDGNRWEVWKDRKNIITADSADELLRRLAAHIGDGECLIDIDDLFLLISEVRGGT